jgi:hypothetical protein
MTTISPKAYPGDLTEAQAELLLPLIPPPKPGGRPPAECQINLPSSPQIPHTPEQSSVANFEKCYNS